MPRRVARAFGGLAARWSGPGSSDPVVTFIHPDAVPVVVVGEDGPDGGGTNVYSTNAASGALFRPRVRLWSDAGLIVSAVGVLDPNASEREFRIRVYSDSRPDSALVNDASPAEFLRIPDTVQASNTSKPTTLGVEGALIRLQNRNGLPIYRPRRPILVGIGQVFEMVGETPNDAPDFVVEFTEGL